GSAASDRHSLFAVEVERRFDPLTTLALNDNIAGERSGATLHQRLTLLITISHVIVISLLAGRQIDKLPGKLDVHGGVGSSRSDFRGRHHSRILIGWQNRSVGLWL